MTDPLPDSFHELRELLIELTDGEPDAAQRARLAELIGADERAGVFYAEYMALHAGLVFEPAEVQVAPDGASTPTENPHAPADAQPSVLHRTSDIGIPLAVAAGFIVVAAVVAIYVFVAGSEPDQAEPDKTPVATLIDASGTVVANGNIGNPGGEYSAGSYSIESGSARFMLTNRVTVDLRGKTELVVRDTMNADLSSGSASFHCPPGAEGYTVHLGDGVRVVDLGTRFRVTTRSDGNVVVHVTEGRVAVENNQTHRVLEANQSVVVARGEIGEATDATRLADQLASDPDMIACYDFKGDSDDRLLDGNEVGEPIHGRIVGARWTDGRLPDKLGLRFGGVDSGDHVELDPEFNDRFNFEGSFSVAVWCRIDRLDVPWQAIIAKGDSSWRIHRHDASDHVSFGTTDVDKFNDDLKSRTEIADGRWHHIVAVYETGPNGSTKRLYVDGKLEAESSAGSIAHSDHPVQIGANAERHRSFNGVIDDVLILGRPLTSQEIESIYEDGRP